MATSGNATAMEPTIKEDILSQWIDLIENISDSQKLKLVGLLLKNPNLQPSLVNEALINDEENTRIAEKWLKKNFREVMFFYCKSFDGFKSESSIEILDKIEFAKWLAPLIVTNYSFILGVAIAFVIWALNKSLNEWCKKYSLRQYSGVGDYTGKFSLNCVNGFMDLDYKPAIKEVEQDIEAFPIKTKFIRIIVPSEIKGRIKLKNKNIVDEIAVFCENGDEQKFSLNENNLHKILKGNVEKAYPASARDPEILRFDAVEFDKPSK